MDKNPCFLLLLQILLLYSSFSSAQYQFQKDGLKQHNQYRAKHQAPPLKLDNSVKQTQTKLNAKATKCAAFYARGGESHTCPEASGLGENISGGFSSRKAPSFGAQTAQGIKAWYDEVKYYNFRNPGPSNFQRTGHFTQLVWKSSRLLGLSCATNPKTQWTYCVSLYQPPGNVASVQAYRANVLPPK